MQPRKDLQVCTTCIASGGINLVRYYVVITLISSDKSKVEQ
jgi:hypothetical protein